jgi:molybdate transport system regulatory protein
MMDDRSGDAPKVRSKIWIERGGDVLLSQWRIDLLRGVEELGSLTASAERLDVPYRTAWQRIKELETRIGTRLVETESGGSAGGGSHLTAEGRVLIARFDRLTAGIDDLVEARMRSEFSGLLRPPRP